MLVERGVPIYMKIYVSYDFYNQTDLDKEMVHDVKPKNKNTPEEKLQIVLAMAGTHPLSISLCFLFTTIFLSLLFRPGFSNNSAPYFFFVEHCRLQQRASP